MVEMSKIFDFPVEKYVVIVKHQMVSGDGKIVKDLDEPIIFTQASVLTPEYESHPMCINQIFDRLKEEVLIRYGEY